MAAPLLTTKLYMPPARPHAVLRPRLIERLTAGLQRTLTLISAPAGFGKTTLVSQWLTASPRPTAWLSLDDGENDPTRFLTYLVAALQTLASTIGDGLLEVLQSGQPPPTAGVLMALLNDLAALPDPVVLVLDDYHLVAATLVDAALTFLLNHLPPQMHLVIATREDPHLPLARLRARGQLTELRVADLRFTLVEAAGFLTQAMGLPLSADDIAVLDRRTEGWIAGLHLAALSLQGHDDAARFVRSFSGSHRFVLDYLVEEVLHQQSAGVQTFLLRTSILDRLCGPLCEAVVRDPATSGQATLDHLDRANLFLVPLDDERRWYRYHQLFAEMLRQRLHQSTAASPGEEGGAVAALHRRASRWYEDQGLALDAFHHAVAAQDVERAARLVDGGGMPLLFRGAVTPVLHWLESLPQAALDARPALWVLYASALTMTGVIPAVEPKLQAAEAARHGAVPDETTHDVVGQVDTILAQPRRAPASLHPSNRASRTSALWTLGIASFLQGDRAAARQAYADALALSEATGNRILEKQTGTRHAGRRRRGRQRLRL